MADDGRRRGAPVWCHLAVLVLVPLLATAGLGAAVVQAHLTAVHDLEAADELLRDSVRIDAVRRAVDHELMPTLIASVVQDEALFRASGMTPGVRRQLLGDSDRAVRDARRRTDAALTEAAAAPGTAEDGRDARRRLHSVRIDADAQLVGPASLATRYLTASDALVMAGHDAAALAGAKGGDTGTAGAIDDVGFVVDLTGLASRQVPLLFAALVVSGAQRIDLQREWEATHGAFERLASTSGALSDPELRQGVYGATTYGVSAALITRASSPRALVPGGPGALLPSQVLDLTPPSAARDAELAQLLDRAVLTALASSAGDRDRARGQLQLTLLVVASVLVASVAVTAAVGRGLARAMARLALAADDASEGVPVVAPERGPRELRRAGEALAHTAAGMHRVREQVEAVARGDLRAALAVTPVPGRLGAGVHASVEAMVRTAEANEALREQLAERASTDALTGLPNRSSTLVAVEAGLARSRSRGTSLAVLFIDLDGFKRVNDTHGHAAGDEVLREAARRMLATVRPGDTAGRLGGDEFVVVAHDLDEASASALAHRLVTVLSEPVALGEDLPDVAVGASAGVALTRGGVLDAAALLALADGAVYRAKAAGRGRVELVDADAALPGGVVALRA